MSKTKQTIVYMRTVEGKPLYRALTQPLAYVDMDVGLRIIPIGFESDGSSVPEILRGVFPRHRHPVAFFRHDWRCMMARTPEERKFADKEFEIDVGKTSWWITKKIGYVGVRIGAIFGIGSNF
jgi:hypothetical protein